MTVSGLLHAIVMIFLSLYAFIVPKYKTADFIYAITVITIVLSWLLFNNECFISYAIRKYQDPTYVMGSDAMNMNDLIDIFGPTMVNYVVNGIIAFMLISFYLVSFRSLLLSPNIMYIFVSCSALFLLSIRHFFEIGSLYAAWLPFDMVFRIIFVIFLFSLLYRLVMKKLGVAQSI